MRLDLLWPPASTRMGRSFEIRKMCLSMPTACGSSWRSAGHSDADSATIARRSRRVLLSRTQGPCKADLPAVPCSTLSEMDILKMLAELRAEREQVEEAILVLERMARGRSKRRGRPPKWMTGMKRRGRPPGSKNKLK